MNNYVAGEMKTSSYTTPKHVVLNRVYDVGIPSRENARLRKLARNYTGKFLNNKTSILTSQTIVHITNNKRQAFKSMQRFISSCPFADPLSFSLFCSVLIYSVRSRSLCCKLVSLIKATSILFYLSHFAFDVVAALPSYILKLSTVRELNSNTTADLVSVRDERHSVF